MKKIFKGCLIASLVLIGIVVVIGAGIYFYSKTPNNIVVLSKPLKISDLKDDNFNLCIILILLNQVIFSIR